MYLIQKDGPEVQLDRTARYGRVGWGFEFLRVLQHKMVNDEK